MISESSERSLSETESESFGVLASPLACRENNYEPLEWIGSLHAIFSCPHLFAAARDGNASQLHDVQVGMGPRVKRSQSVGVRGGAYGYGSLKVVN